MAERNFDEIVRKQALKQLYRDKRKERENSIKAKLSEEQQVFLRGYWSRNTIYEELVRGLRDGAVPSAYIREHMPWFLCHILPETEHGRFFAYVDAIRDYPYPKSYTRRAFRCASYAPYAEQIADCMQKCLSIAYDDSHPVAALTRTLPEEQQVYLDDSYSSYLGYTDMQITELLDAHDPAAEDAIRSILLSESGGALTHALVRGIFRSHRPEFYELLYRLLVAARLQEGVRQVICEVGDCGTRESFLGLLRVIDENNLIRFSGVKRAVGKWLGIVSYDTHDLDRVSNKSVRLLRTYLEDPDARKAALDGEDAMEIYIALWSYAFEDLEATVPLIADMSAAGRHHQVLVAGYFAAQTGEDTVSHRIALRAVFSHENENDTLAILLPSVLPGRWRLLTHAPGKDPAGCLTDYFTDLEEALAFASLLERKIKELGGKLKLFSPCVFPWYAARLTKYDLTELYCTVAGLSKQSDLIDRACAYLPDCPPDFREMFIGSVLYPPNSELQRHTLICAVSDKQNDTRQRALALVRNLSLTAEEYRMLESFLRFKSAEIRAGVLSLLLMQKDVHLPASITRLLDSDKEEMRLGGLDLLTRLKADAERSYLVPDFLPRLAARLREEELPSKERVLLETFVPTESDAVKTADALCGPDDVYLPDFSDLSTLPEEFDTFWTSCIVEFKRCFPDSAIEELMGARMRALHGTAKGIWDCKINDTPCASAKEADDDLRSLSKYIEQNLTTILTDGTYKNEPCMLGEIGYLYYSKDGERSQSIPGAALWDAWAAERGMTPERILRACVRYEALPDECTFRQACSPLLCALYGAGFDIPFKLPHIDKIQSILQYIYASIPAPFLAAVGAAVGLWFLHCVPDHLVTVGIENGPEWQQLHAAYSFSAIGSKTRGREHLLTHGQLSFLLAQMDCQMDDTLPMTFPIAVAVAERCLAAYDTLTEPEEHPSPLIYVDTPAYKKITRELWKTHKNRNYGSCHLVGATEYLRAVYKGVITEAQFFEFALRIGVLRHVLEALTLLSAEYCARKQGKDTHGSTGTYLTRRSRKALEVLIGTREMSDAEKDALLSYMHRLNELLLPVVVEPEYKRGDSRAAYSSYICSIQHIAGVSHLVRILEALGSEKINRDTYYGGAWYQAPERNITLSKLLYVSSPAAGEDGDSLRAALAGKKISDKRLIEAALYAPDWIPIVGEYLGVDGFASACYYFIAHMNESFDERRRALIARYTPLDTEELNLGAFDRAWFESAYTAVGETVFEKIYSAAKYITDGAKHARARKYADACLGKYRVEELETAIADKRNKDLLMAYALIPSGGEDDICRRYRYIEEFRRESKMFDSQRSASEKKAADMALTNLAQTAGYSDTMRLTLRMETRLLERSSALLRPHTVDDVVLEVVIGEDGQSELAVTKDGKRLKSIPAKLKKNETVLALSELKKTLTEQYRRTRLMLEEAMECEIVFTMEEISALLAHPVVRPMLTKLVLVSEEDCGFATSDGLLSPDGITHPMPPDTPLRIAHPFTLYTRGVWREYQAYLYEKQIVQPYRQVFRELYVKTADERGRHHSLRYAGNQIQPKKTVAVLRSRRWVADIEEGLQKVYYKENIVARIYALADWFSPADIEAPTLEWVEFFDRHSGRNLPIDDIPDILFSEVMRDVDLAVSVAHVGGVDPEASHSSVEMREAILAFLLPMLRVTNVKVENHRAVIAGRIANYTVHLGSGVVHQIGGTMIPVLPVHSQHRGQLFLPFVDEDPKTAEILSKILLFAADDRIRDPMILAEIQR